MNNQIGILFTFMECSFFLIDFKYLIIYPPSLWLGAFSDFFPPTEIKKISNYSRVETKLAKIVWKIYEINGRKTTADKRVVSFPIFWGDKCQLGFT